MCNTWQASAIRSGATRVGALGHHSILERPKRQAYWPPERPEQLQSVPFRPKCSISPAPPYALPPSFGLLSPLEPRSELFCPIARLPIACGIDPPNRRPRGGARLLPPPHPQRRRDRLRLRRRSLARRHRRRPREPDHQRGGSERFAEVQPGWEVDRLQRHLRRSWVR